MSRLRRNDRSLLTALLVAYALVLQLIFSGMAFGQHAAAAPDGLFAGPICSSGHVDPGPAGPGRQDNPHGTAQCCLAGCNAAALSLPLLPQTWDYARQGLASACSVLAAPGDMNRPSGTLRPQAKPRAPPALA